MKETDYERCLNKHVSWEELARILGYKNANVLRCQYRYEKAHRGESKKSDTSGESASYEESDEYINLVLSSKRMRSKEDVIKEFKINTDEWEVSSFEVRTSEGYRKDRKVDWHVTDGKVISGDVEDTGMMLVVPMYHIRVKLIRKTEEIKVRSFLLDMIADAKKYAPKYPKINYAKKSGDMLYEIDMPDAHIGRLTWDEESGENYDIKIAEETITKVLSDLLSYSKLFPIKKILLPLGNDWYNVNSKSNTTVNGTPQQEDTRWSKTYRKGWQLAVKIVEMCSVVAPVDVLIVKGNHDEERTFYLGETLSAWFHKNPNVDIDNRAVSRKYYLYGKNLIGFTHGGEFKIDKLPSIMPFEVPDLWAKSKFREFHLGHVHHKFEVNEENGVVVRFLRALVPLDAWTFDKGFVGAQRAAESFVWDHQLGLRAQFTATP